MTQYKTAFLLDRNNDWLVPFISKSTLFQQYSDRFAMETLYDADSVRGYDIVFILGYMKILSQDFLSGNVLNLVIHESPLPLGKGFAPVQWQILEGKNIVPLCLFEATEKLDSGNILEECSITFTGYELYDEIRSKQFEATIQIICKFLDKYPSITRRIQSGKESYYRKRHPKDGELDPDKTIRSQFNLLRIGNNESWPSFFVLDGKKYTLKIYSEPSNES